MKLSKKKVENNDEFYYLFEIWDIVSVVDNKWITSIWSYWWQTDNYIILTKYHVDDPYYNTWKKEWSKPEWIYYKSIDRVSMW